jgi:hypothetical protein
VRDPAGEDARIEDIDSRRHLTHSMEPGGPRIDGRWRGAAAGGQASS